MRRSELGMRLAVAIGLGLCIGACGDDDDGGGGYSSGIPKSKQLADLTVDESMMACEGFADSLETSLSADAVERAACTGASLATSIKVEGNKVSIDVAACKEAVDECLAQGDEAQADLTSDVDCDSAELSEDLEDCEATVGEFENCINAALSELRKQLNLLSCDALGREGALEDLMEMEEADSPFSIAQCQALSDKCPGIDLFDDESSSGEIGSSGQPPSASGCDDTCSDAEDGFCDDGGPGADTNICGLGTDCSDCGAR